MKPSKKRHEKNDSIKVNDLPPKNDVEGRAGIPSTFHFFYGDDLESSRFGRDTKHLFAVRFIVVAILSCGGAIVLSSIMSFVTTDFWSIVSVGVIGGIAGLVIAALCWTSS